MGNDVNQKRLADGVRAQVDGYEGIIIIGPFNCLPFRIAEAILNPLIIGSGMPILRKGRLCGVAVLYQTSRGPRATGSRAQRAKPDP